MGGNGEQSTQECPINLQKDFLPTTTPLHLPTTTIWGNWLYFNFRVTFGGYPQSKTVSVSQKPIITLDPWKIKGWYLKTEPWKQKIPLYQINNMKQLWQKNNFQAPAISFHAHNLCTRCFFVGTFPGSWTTSVVAVPRPPVASPGVSPRVPVLAAYRCAPLECGGSERNEAAWQVQRVGSEELFWCPKNSLRNGIPGSLAPPRSQASLKILWETEWLQKNMFVFSGF